jgi:hypothetical protein
MMAGVLMIVAGLALTLITYIASGPGQTYMVFWGLVAVGAWRLFKPFLAANIQENPSLGRKHKPADDAYSEY